MLETIREYFGLSQNEIASYLVLSKHMVQSIEQSRRALSRDMRMDTLPLVTAMNAILKDGPGEVPLTPSRQEQKDARHKFLTCRRKLRTNTQALVVMQKTYQETLRKLPYFLRAQQELANPHNFETTHHAYHTKWINNMISLLNYELQKNSLIKQQILAARIAGQEAELALLEAIQADLSLPEEEA